MCTATWQQAKTPWHDCLTLEILELSGHWLRKSYVGGLAEGRWPQCHHRSDKAALLSAEPEGVVQALNALESSEIGSLELTLYLVCHAARKPWTLPIRGSQQNVVDSIAWNPKHLVLASAGAYSDGGSSKHAHTGNIIIYAPLVSS